MRKYYFDDMKLSKKFKKDKEIKLYKAFIDVKDNEELEVNTMGDYFSLTPEDAMRFALSYGGTFEEVPDIVQHTFDNLADGKTLVAVVEFTFNKESMEESPISKEQDEKPFEDDTTMKLLIHDKVWTMRIFKYNITEFKGKFSDDGGIQKFNIEKFKYVDAN